MDRVQTNPSVQGHLQQRFSVLSSMAMAFAILNTWIALAGSIGLVLPSGGSTALLYGFILCVLCNFALAASLGEMAAIWPTAGGQYHFVYALCTEKWRRPISFIAGWANITGWLTVTTVQGFFAAQFISAAIVIASGSDYVITSRNTYGIFAAVMIAGTVVNIFGNKILEIWSKGALYWSVGGVIIISVVLLAMAQKTSAEFVFTEFNNETGWPDGMAWLLGLLQPALSLIGFDVVMHMAEEMPNPSKDIPRAMIYAVAVGGVTGTLFVLVSLFCFWDPDAFFATDTGIAASELLLQATKSRAGATVLNLLLAVCFVNGTIASITSASRLMWAMARDDGVFFARTFGKIKHSLDVPVYTILFTGVFNLVFGLLYLGPTVAFSAYVASCTLFLNVSYAFPVLVLLIRGRGVLEQYRYPGVPHQLGRWGYAINYIAAIFVLLTTVLFSFPIALPVDGNNMNYVVVVIAIFLIFVGAFWFTRGKQFKGPDFEAIFGLNHSIVQEGEPMDSNIPESKEPLDQETIKGSQTS